MDKTPQMMSNILRKTLLGCSILIAAPALAQETEPKEEVIDSVLIRTQSLFNNVDINRQASSTVYIGTRELRKFDYTDINRVLMGRPGVHLYEEDGLGLRPNLSIRGSQAGRSQGINVMEDGVPVAPAPYLASAAYFFPNVGRMAGIEILKGGGQIKYGPNTVGGSINLISTQIPSKPAGFLDASYGSFNTKRVHTYAGGKAGKFGILAEYFHMGSNGFKTISNGKKAGMDLHDFVAKAVYDNSEGKIPNILQFKIQHSTENSDETYLGITRQDFAVRPFERYIASELDNMKTDRTQYVLSYQIKPIAGLTLNLDAYRNEFARNWFKTQDIQAAGSGKVKLSDALLGDNNTDAVKILKGMFEGDNTIYIRHNNRKYVTQGVQLNGLYDFGSSKLNFGLRSHFETEDRFQQEDQYRSTAMGLVLKKKGAPGSQDNRLTRANTFAAFAQYQIEWHKFVATAGARVESMRFTRDNFGKADPERKGGKDLKKSNNKTTTFIPGISLLYKAAQDVNLFAGVHKGFRPPGINDGQKAESSVNYELGARYNNNYWDAEVIGYLNDYSNMLGSDMNATGGNAGMGELYNHGAVKISGIESQARYVINGKTSEFNIPIGATYTYLGSRFQTDFKSSAYDDANVKKGDELPFIPKHQLRADIDINYRNFSIGATYNYRGEVRSKPGQGVIEANQKVNAISLVDLHVNYTPIRFVNLYFVVQNVLNKTYITANYPSGVRPGMPRFFNIGTKIRI